MPPKKKKPSAETAEKKTAEKKRYVPIGPPRPTEEDDGVTVHNVNTLKCKLYVLLRDDWQVTSL